MLIVRDFAWNDLNLFKSTFLPFSSDDKNRDMIVIVTGTATTSNIPNNGARRNDLVIHLEYIVIWRSSQ